MESLRERVQREAQRGSVDVTDLVLSEAVMSTLELSKPQAKIIIAWLTGDHDTPEVAALWRRTDLKHTHYVVALDGLVTNGLVNVLHDEVDFDTLGRKLHMVLYKEEDKTLDYTPPTFVPTVEFKPFRTEMLELASNNKNKVAGLANVYTRVYGRRPSNFRLVGALYSKVGLAEAVDMMLRMQTYNFEGEPIMVMLSIAAKQAAERAPEPSPLRPKPSRGIITPDQW